MFSRENKKILAIYSGLAFLFVYPLLQAGIFYRDDLDRAITGQYGWNGLGRPLADLLMRILSASGHYNLDLFPYTLLLSCVLLGLSALQMKNYLSQLSVPHSVFVSALLIFNPFMLQNMAYRYDCLGMALAFLLAVLAYTFTAKNRACQYLTQVACGVSALMLYQPCANIFLGLAAIEVVIAGIRDKNFITHAAKLLAKKAAIFIVFYVVYMLLIMHKDIPRAELVPFNSDGFLRVTHTFNALSRMLSAYFYGPVYTYFLIPVCSLVLLSIVNRRHRLNSLFPFYLSLILSLVIFMVSLMGPAILLNESPVLPRMLISFSILFILLALPVVFLAPKLKWLVLIPVITSFAFSAQLGSAMKSQREHEDFIFSMISRDINSHQNISFVRTVGQVTVNERAKLLVENKPLIGYFLSPATQFLASFQLINKGIVQTTKGYVDESENKQLLQKIIAQNIQPDISNAEYSVYFQNDTALVKLGH